MTQENAKRAPSLSLNYNYTDQGDILLQDVLVPTAGLAKCTYYCCLCWNVGQEGGGYCGIQDHPDGRAFIFSIWDPQHVKHQPITAVHKGPGTWTDRFGGEGTGLKSMNFELGWKENQWYTMLVRRWDSPNGQATRFGCWVHDQSANTWTHLITMEYPVPEVFFSGVTASFLEDWGFTCENYRCVHYKCGFKRKLDKSWMPFSNADFKVNMYDVNNGTATMNFDAKCSDPKQGICIAAGADVKGDTGTCCNFSDHSFESHSPKKPIKIEKLDMSGKSLMWVTDKASAPQFKFKIKAADQELCCGFGENITEICLSDRADTDGGMVVVEVEDILGNCDTQSVTMAN